jgi:hypothetical protein
VILAGSAEVAPTPVEVELRTTDTDEMADADEVVLVALVVVDRVMLNTPHVLPELSEVAGWEDDCTARSVTVVCTVVVVVLIELEAELVAAVVEVLLPVEMAEDTASLRLLWGITLSPAAVVARVTTARGPVEPGMGSVSVEEME